MAKHLVARFTALVVSVFVALVAGTPYLYGIYAPQLCSRVGISTSKAAVISLAVTIGTGCGGLPAGLLIDNFGPKILILVGSSCIFSGYFVLNRIYALLVPNLPLICMAMCLVGFGSGTSFFSCLKASQANFPDHRGTASAFPIGAFGLAATVFLAVAAAFYAEDTGGLLLFLSLTCGSVAFFGSWFVHVYDLDDTADAESDRGPHPRLQRQSSFIGKLVFWGINRSNSNISTERTPLLQGSLDRRIGQVPSSIPATDPLTTQDAKKDAQLVSDLQRLNTPREIVFTLATNKIFLIHYLILSLCSGVGQMYIFTIGFTVRAQFYRNAGEYISPASLQALQVSVISISQFGGRIAAGMLSDIIKKKFNAQRQWLVLVTILFMMCGQLILIFTDSVTLLTMISVLMGISYGMLNGNYPSIFADTFGTKHFTTAWGLACSGPIIILYPLQLYFGWIYDSHSADDNKCYEGRACYRGAFQAGLMLNVLTFVVTSALIYKRRL